LRFIETRRQVIDDRLRRMEDLDSSAERVEPLTDCRRFEHRTPFRYP
jgi:hypothetical protein